MKNVVKCYKDFLGYFNALKTHCAYSLFGTLEYIAENLVKCKKKLFSSDSKFELQHLPQKYIHNNLLHLLHCLTLLQTAEFDWFDLGVAFLRSFKA